MSERAANAIVQLGSSVAVGYCGRMLALSGAEVTVVGAEPVPVHPALGAVRAYLDQEKTTVAGEVSRETLQAALKGANCLIADRTLDELAALGLDVSVEGAGARGLVLVSVTPWGSSGPPAMRHATDLHMFHGGGLGSITPRFANNPEEPPLRTGYPLSDYFLGLNAAVCAMAGINHLRETGQGSVIDVSGQHAIAHAEAIYFAAYGYEHRNSSRVSRAGLAPFHFIPCLDGHVMIICPEEHQWRSLVDLMGNPEWAENELFATSASRALYWDAIEPEVTAWFATRTRDELYRLAQEKRIPLAPVNNADAVLASRHLAAREYFQPLATASGAPLMAPGRPFRQQRRTGSAEDAPRT